MDSNIGNTTTDIAISDEVKQFKTRVLQKNGTSSGSNKAPSSPRKKVRYNPDSLTMLCLKVIAKNFTTRPVINKLLDKQVPVLTSMLDVDLDIEIAAAHIYDENYWKRRAMAQDWKHFQLSNHGMTWKQLYLERMIEDLLEGYIPDEELPQEGCAEGKEDHVTESAILAHLRAGQDYVFQLRIGQLLSHIDLNVLFDTLPNLARLDLAFGVKHVGMHYDRSLFGMKMCDATSLACAIKKTYTLTSLSLTCNLIDDDLLRMLMTGLISNSTITHLDLSHNKITNHGVRLLSKLLGPKSVITSLDLCDNQIHVEGGRYLGRALKRNNSLLELNLRLNRLSDEGGAVLCEGLGKNSSLCILNLSSNSLSAKTVKSLCRAIENPKSALSALDLSCNDFAEEDGETLLYCLRKRCSLVSLDLRKNNLAASATAIAAIVKKAELQSRREYQSNN